ncbi:MAG: hypothetical protein DRR08_13495 [Candidatus Parabeggiatoa sp. nov. 2]|nr:MAG: hypothetical protein B6247_06165 [Beggiatoa sp. 4572_84]RKZ59605.1 MAG: hypothetical protein DRR08_13495 [Gammaproteobacteria bacterium]HEC84966.1 hypothetical protein [Thioploca sp.]
MSKTFSSLSTELRKNTRLRAGLWLIVAISISYLVLLLNDYQVKLQQEHQSASTRLNQLQTITSQTQWLERAAQAQALRSQLQVKFWQANTQGLAQATFQKWLDTEMKRAKLIKKAYLRIKSVLEMPNDTNAWKVTARIDAPFTQRSLNRLLFAIAQHPLFIVTERLEIRHSRTPRLTLIVSAYFKAPVVSS